MKTHTCNQVRKTLLSLLMIIVFFAIGSSQNDVVPSKSLLNSVYAEFGGTYYNFRDEGSSSLGYAGLGGGHIGFGFHKIRNQKLHQEIQIFYEYGEVIPAQDGGIWSTIHRLSGKYNMYTDIGKLYKPLKWQVGVSFTSEALYMVYPYFIANNGDAYSFDLASLGVISGLSYNTNRSRIQFQTTIDLIEWNVRPQAYNGVSPSKVFTETKITGLHNNFRVFSSLSYLWKFKNSNQIGLDYNWRFQHNTSTFNALIFAQHNLMLKFYFNLK